MRIKYGISYEAVKKEFVEHGVYYCEQDCGRLLSVWADPTELTKEERQLILDTCNDDGDGDFTYDHALIDFVCYSVEELLGAIRGKENTFGEVVAATGKNFEIEKSMSGYFRLMLDGEPVVDDSACEDLNGTYKGAENYFIDYLLEHEVPEDKKIMRCGVWFLKN